jgi:hypothetical protein
MDKVVLDEMLSEAREMIARDVFEGFNDADQIVANITETVESDHDGEGLRPFIERLTAELIEEHRRRQSQWVGPTDCDRLDEAFTALEAEGIVARQNFTCCQTCGHAEIWGEIEEASAERDIDGYVFYHMQDTESACEGGGLYLAYGTTEGGSEEAADIGWRIVGALERAGLTVHWNGKTSQRIAVQVEWRRRRT